MINYYIYAALTRERRKTTLAAEAEAARRAKQARSHQQRASTSVARRSPLRSLSNWLSSDWNSLLHRQPRSAATGKRVVLRDGSQVLVRQVRGADAQLLADGFARLSAQSRQLRFLTPKKELSPAELRYFTEVDHHDHEALGALNPADGRGVGIARYIRDAEDPQAAEIAVTIVDDWQGRGLGTELLSQLSDRARSEGIRRFTALVASENVAMAGLLRNVGADLVRREPGIKEHEIALTSPGTSTATPAAGICQDRVERRAVGQRPHPPEQLTQVEALRHGERVERGIPFGRVQLHLAERLADQRQGGRQPNPVPDRDLGQLLEQRAEPELGQRPHRQPGRPGGRPEPGRRCGPAPPRARPGGPGP
jgi:RimJ/RimL family protein N-acetyltransferase